MKRFGRFFAVAATGALLLSGCSSSNGGGSSADAASPSASASAECAETTAAPSVALKDTSKTYEIGAVTIVSHPALDAVSQGFQCALKAAGAKFNYDFQNPQGDQATLNSIAQTFASQDKDLYFAIATPPVQALSNVITDTPILFAGVTDPVAADVVESWEAPGGNVTGMSDLSPVKEQLELLKEIAPDAKTVGIVYSSSEANSEVLVNLAKDAAGDLGLEIKTATVVNSSEVQQAAESLDVDAYYVPTDNTVVSAVEALVQVADDNKRLVVAADIDSVKRGAAAALSIDYYKQGEQAAAMAINLLNGAEAATMPVETQDQLELYINPTAAKAQGATLPEAVTSRANETVEG